MDLSSLKPSQGSNKKRKRIARGIGSGYGGTATKGHKGAQSRAGYSRRLGFEGGQMPLQRRVPKYGFKNINRVEYRPVNLEVLQNLANNKNITAIDPEVLIKEGIAGKNERIKILGRGEFSAKLEVKAHKFSKSAQKAIEDNEGTAIKLQ